MPAHVAGTRAYRTKLVVDRPDKPIGYFRFGSEATDPVRRDGPPMTATLGKPT
jgi:hypothetical protein